jgi:putative hydrolases of HD superfamily
MVNAVPMDATELYEPIAHMARLAAAFGRTDRTAVLYPDQDGKLSPESDSDHTVMLGWVAPAVAARCCPDLDTGLVAQFSLVHDAPETLAGDTSTLRITPAQREAKAHREACAVKSLHGSFGASLPWFSEMIIRYERQSDPEARFVKAMDKLVVKLVHLIDGCAGIRQHGVSAAEFVDMVAEQRTSLQSYAGGFPGLLGLHARLCAEVAASLRDLERLPA